MQASTAILDFINFSQEEVEELFIQTRSGDSQAFIKLSAKVRNICYSYFLLKYKQGKIINIDDVDDLTNNVYLSFAEQYQNIENLEYWLRRVLFLNFVGWYKKNRKWKMFELKDCYLQDYKINPSEKLDSEIILAYVGAISSDKQMILKMRFWEGLKFADIADIMGKSEDAVKKMFYRTIEDLKNIF